MTIQFISVNGDIRETYSMNNCCGSIFGPGLNNPGIRVLTSSDGSFHDAVDELEDIVKLDEDNFIHYLHTVVCPPRESDDDY